MESPRSIPPRVGMPIDASLADAVELDADLLTDDESARRAREQYREHGVPALEADATIAPHLGPMERVLGCRAAAIVARINDATHQAVGDEGPLYVTSGRLLHLGASQTTSVALADIGELTMGDDRILVTVGGASGLMVDVSEPRQFRVLLAAAKSAAGR